MGRHVAERTMRTERLEGAALSEAMWENVQHGRGRHVDYLPPVEDSGWDERIGVTE